MTAQIKIKHHLLRRYNPPQYNDIVLRPKNVIQNGALPLGSKAALYLIFPQNGLAASHLIALEYMIENGYSPIVVSNLPLSDRERHQLVPLTYRVLERENFGYDFGGYREGILIFQDQIKNLDRLVLFNDSVWFPTQDTRNWLMVAEAADKDLMGALSHTDVGNKELQEDLAFLSDQTGRATGVAQRISDPQSWFDDFSNKLIDYKTPPKLVLKVRNYLRNRRNLAHNKVSFHYCSFALLIGANILRDPDFFSFWQNLRISSDSVQTVVRGEIGFTQWVIRKNFSHDCAINAENIAQNIAQMDESKLVEHLRKLAPVSYERALLETYVQKAGAQGHPSNFTKSDKQSFLWFNIKHGNSAYFAAFYLHQEHFFQFFKKKNFSSSRFGRKVAQDMIAFMPEPIKSEMKDVFEKSAHLGLETQDSLKTRGKRKIFGVWVGLPRFWG